MFYVLAALSVSFWNMYLNLAPRAELVSKSVMSTGALRSVFHLCLGMEPKVQTESPALVRLLYFLDGVAVL